MKKPISRLLEFIRPYKWKYIGALICSILYTLARTSQPFLIGLSISELARNLRDYRQAGILEINFKYIGIIAGLIALTGVLDAIGEYLADYLLAIGVQDTTMDIRSRIYEKINRLPVEYFDKRQQGEILSRLTTDVSVLSEAMQQILTRVVSAILSLAFTIVFMFRLSPFFSMIGVLMFPIIYFVFRFFIKKTQPIFNDLQNAIGKMNGHAQEYYVGHQVIQLFNQEEEVIHRFNQVNTSLNKTSFKANFISSTINPILSSISHFFYIGLFLGLSLTVLNKPLVLFGVVVAKQMEIGGIQAFIQYIWQSAGPIGQITQQSTLFQTASASLGRVFNILDEEEEEKIDETYEIDYENLKGDIRLEDVKFSYSTENPLMKSINVDVKSGDTVAIVGPTGAGKTTLINLLMRFYNIDGGKITIDGMDIAKLSKRQSRSLFGVVFQHPWLYSTTIGENIRFGKLNATREEIIEAAETARADHFIRTLPEGYNTLINEDTTNVSQGEKQLITIARALIRDPEILILDEATSSVDTRLEKHIQVAMDTAMKGRTSFIIAHRLSTIRNADLILVMQHGAIVEQGNHNELIDQGGVYKDLYESQFI